jgi:hypothetical protein
MLTNPSSHCSTIKKLPNFMARDFQSQIFITFLNFKVLHQSKNYIQLFILKDENPNKLRLKLSIYLECQQSVLSTVRYPY